MPQGFFLRYKQAWYSSKIPILLFAYYNYLRMQYLGPLRYPLLYTELDSETLNSGY